MWGYSVQFWEIVFRIVTIGALIFGGFTAATAFASAWIGYQLTDIVQKDANRRITEAEAKVSDSAVKIATANADVAKANEKAAAAQASVAGANERIAEAKADAAKAISSAAGANAKAADFERQAAQAHAEAEKARLEQEKMKAALSWRVLTDQASAAFEKALGSKPGVVNLAYTSGDNEGLFLAIQIAKIFEKLKWQFTLSGYSYPNSVVAGFWLNGNGAPDESRVSNALKAAGITPSTTALPPPTMSLGGTLPKAPLLFIGIKSPVL
jgi:hypothetical protein